MFLADINFGEALLVAFEVFFFVIWIWILITILSDLFRDHETSGWAKAAWVLFLVFIPFLTAHALILQGRLAARSAMPRLGRPRFFAWIVAGVLVVAADAAAVEVDRGRWRGR